MLRLDWIRDGRSGRDGCGIPCCDRYVAVTL